MPLHDRIPETALAWHHDGQAVALATVIATWGSAPWPAGSQMAVSGTGQIAGSVSGGCIEGEVVLHAEDALRDGRPRLLSFGVSDETAFAAGLACGGTIRVLVEPVGEGPQALPPPLLAALAAARAAHRPVALVTDLDTWCRTLLGPKDDTDVARALKQDRSLFLDETRFIAVHPAPLRLIIVGAVHIAQALVPMAQSCGYAVKVIDPRTSFAAAARFPGVPLIDAWPDAGVAVLAPDARAAVVVLTHDPKLDDAGLIAALASPAFYIGALGSRKSHAKRCERLRGAGVKDVALARIHAPVGLAIGAVTPAEIAVSIVAEMTAALRHAGHEKGPQGAPDPSRG